MAAQLQRESTEFIYIGVSGAIPSDGAEIAFMDNAESRPTDEWEEAIVVEDAQHELWADAQASGISGDYYIARLIGSFGDGGSELAPGTYQPWVRLTDTVEQPVLIAPEVVEIL